MDALTEVGISYMDRKEGHARMNECMYVCEDLSEQKVVIWG